MREHRLQILVIGLGEVGRDVARTLEPDTWTGVDPQKSAFDKFNDADIALLPGTKSAGTSICRRANQ